MQPAISSALRQDRAALPLVPAGGRLPPTFNLLRAASLLGASARPLLGRVQRCYGVRRTTVPGQQIMIDRCKEIHADPAETESEHAEETSTAIPPGSPFGTPLGPPPHLLPIRSPSCRFPVPSARHSPPCRGVETASMRLQEGPHFLACFPCDSIILDHQRRDSAPSTTLIDSMEYSARRKCFGRLFVSPTAALGSASSGRPHRLPGQICVSSDMRGPVRKTGVRSRPC